MSDSKLIGDEDLSLADRGALLQIISQRNEALELLNNLAGALRAERDAYLTNLTSTQVRCTELLESVRYLRALIQAMIQSRCSPVSKDNQ